jgi:hypothetical protein
MRLMRYALSVAVALSLTLAAQAGDDAQKGKNKAKAKKKGNTVAGTVVEVKKDKDKDEGTITVKIQAKKKKDAGAPATAEEKTFKVTTATKFEKVSGKKGEQQVTAANFAAVHKGEHVRLTVKDGTAEDVKILSKGKKKKKAAD